MMTPRIVSSVGVNTPVNVPNFRGALVAGVFSGTGEAYHAVLLVPEGRSRAENMDHLTLKAREGAWLAPRASGR
jgi:hypothetical protein